MEDILIVVYITNTMYYKCLTKSLSCQTLHTFSWLHRNYYMVTGNEKDPDAGKDWRREEKGTTEDEMVGWHHRLDGHEFEQAPGVGDRQGSLGWCSPWGRKESDITERVNWSWFSLDLFSSFYLRWVFVGVNWLLIAMVSLVAEHRP